MQSIANMWYKILFLIPSLKEKGSYNAANREAIASSYIDIFFKVISASLKLHCVLRGRNDTLRRVLKFRCMYVMGINSPNKWSKAALRGIPCAKSIARDWFNRKRSGSDRRSANEIYPRASIKMKHRRRRNAGTRDLGLWNGALKWNFSPGETCRSFSFSLSYWTGLINIYSVDLTAKICLVNFDCNSAMLWKASRERHPPRASSFNPR